MRINFDSLTPIYVQVAGVIEDDIIAGKLVEGGPVYSQLILSRELNINPATAAKGINLLVSKGILEKQRGLSMIVASGARETLLCEKRESELLEAAQALVNIAVKTETGREALISTINELFSKTEGRK